MLAQPTHQAVESRAFLGEEGPCLEVGREAHLAATYLEGAYPEGMADGLGRNIRNSRVTDRGEHPYRKDQEGTGLEEGMRAEELSAEDRNQSLQVGVRHLTHTQR